MKKSNRSRSNKNEPRRRGPSGRRTDAPELGGNRFRIDGEAAIKEYLRHRLEAVLSIQAKSPESWAEFAGQVPIQQAPEDHPAPATAEVKLNTLAEQDWLNKIEHEKPALVLALDQVTDPRNLGAIVRSAAFFGVTSVLVAERRQVGLTGASVAAAQGGFAITNLVTVKNLGRAMETLRSHGYWSVGAAGDGEPFKGVAGFYERTLLVMGSEGRGLSQSVRQKCDRIVGIAGRPDGLDSLNVSVATGILLQSFTNHP